MGHILGYRQATEAGRMTLFREPCYVISISGTMIWSTR
jgi:hypothetical protein